ncbi:FAD-binding protein [Photobacterium sanguinicancri]|uniref:FAD-binding protein n=1 Tax=Photobacterium sanguinicancri TaxID=875932 RepID=UPI003D09A262
MINNIEKTSLSELTTLGVGGKVKNLISIKNKSELKLIYHDTDVFNGSFTVLGEGSNVCFSDSEFDGYIIKLVNKGIEVINETDDSIYLSVAAGENWDDLVSYTVEQGFWGIENMSLIPGSVGACPVQNVGAYGQDCRDVIHEVKAYDISKNAFVSISNSACNFGFRTSIFNETRAINFIISDVVFKLSKHPQPNVTRKGIYKSVSNSLESDELQKLIRAAVISERSDGKNLPTDTSIGCAGTFFRTAVVKKADIFHIFFKTLFSLGPRVALMMLGFTIKYRSKDGCKLPSKFLIDACNISGFRKNSVFLFPSNSAVLATDKKSTPKSEDIIYVIRYVRETVYLKTGVKIPIEPTLIGFSKSELEYTFGFGDNCGTKEFL